MAVVTKSTTGVTAEHIARFYRMLIDKQPDQPWIDNEAARVDSGVTTLGQVLRGLFQSPSFQESHAADVVRLFYLAVGRAPDAALHEIAMQALRDGMTYGDLVSILLTVPGNPLSNDGLPGDGEFVSVMAQRALGAADPGLETQLVALLQSGAVSRGDLLATVSTLPGLAVVPVDAEIAALSFLAGSNREVTQAELEMPHQTLDARIIQALAANGLSATGGKLALHRAEDTVTMFSELLDAFRWDVPADRYTLKAQDKFQVFYSTDRGLSGSIIDFDPAMARDASVLDASLVTGPGKISFVGSSHRNNIFKAPAGGSQATGGMGNDYFVGNTGNDTFFVTAGRDVLTGGLGDDVFIFPSSVVYQNGGEMTHTARIMDFGLGNDTLDLTRLLNLTGKPVDVKALTAVQATTTPLRALTNGSVTLVDNDGLWTAGSGTTLIARKPEASDISALFSQGLAGEPPTLFKAPSNTGKFVLITADTVTTADVWLIHNSVAPREITDGVNGPLEIFKIAELTGSWNPSLAGMTSIPGNGMEDFL